MHRGSVGGGHLYYCVARVCFLALADFLQCRLAPATSPTASHMYMGCHMYRPHRKLHRADMVDMHQAPPPARKQQPSSQATDHIASNTRHRKQPAPLQQAPLRHPTLPGSRPPNMYHLGLTWWTCITAQAMPS